MCYFSEDFHGKKKLLCSLPRISWEEILFKINNILRYFDGLFYFLGKRRPYLRKITFLGTLMVCSIILQALNSSIF